MAAMSDSSPEVPAKPDLTDTDLYCLHCGYNLRGLSGDPRRCPECGNINPMGDLELPAALISEQLKRMETNPVLCVAAVFFGSPLLVMLVFAVLDGCRLDEIASCEVVPAFAAVVVWSIGATGFKNSCGARPGWLGVLWLYHLCALLLCAGVAGLFLAPMILQDLVGRNSWFSDAPAILPMVIILVGLILLIGVAGRWVHHRLKAAMEPLQRDRAVQIAREVLQRRLRRATR
jgi:hypothetical protein